MANTLYLRLEGLLQAWGDDRGRHNIRPTAPYPTKSGVIGLISAALGYNTDKQILPLFDQLHMGVRIDRPGTLMVDFQTVRGIDDDDLFMQANGKLKKSTYSIVTEREYLAGASFLVAIQGDPALLSQIANALKYPCWPLYLGRRSCLSWRQTFYAGEGDYETLEDALMHGEWTDRYVPPETGQVLAVLETVPEHGVRYRHRHLSAEKRRFGPLYLRKCILDISHLFPEKEDSNEQNTTTDTVAVNI